MNDIIRWGQLVIGPPGSGKSKYCWGIQGYLKGTLEGNAETQRLQREVVVVNLDPGNEHIPYHVDVDVRELVAVESVMERMGLGPNGSLLYCMEFLERNLEWLQGRIDALSDRAYVVFDCPGQVELFTHHPSLRNILAALTGSQRLRLAAVHLVDSHYCTDLSLFVAAALTSLTTMLQLELAHVNVLTKVDLLRFYGRLPFKLEFFTDMLDMQHLVERLEESAQFPGRFKRLNAAMVELISDFNLVAFLPLNVFDPISFSALIKQIDKANGYIPLPPSHQESNGPQPLNYSSNSTFSYDHASLIQDLFIDSD